MVFKFLFVCLAVFNATFNNISVISWRSLLLVKETRGPGDNHRPVASSKISLSVSCQYFLIKFRPFDVLYIFIQVRVLLFACTDNFLMFIDLQQFFSFLRQDIWTWLDIQDTSV